MGLLMLWFGMTCKAQAAEFEAKTLETKKGTTTTGRLFVKDSKYRLELEQKGEKAVILVDSARKQVQVLNVDKKEYLEIPNDDFRVLSMDPFLAARYITGKNKAQSMGTESVDGHACEKNVTLMQGKPFLTQWISQKYAFPFKIVQQMGKQKNVVTLTDIKEKPVAEAMFEVPRGYAQMEDPVLAARKKREEIKKKEAALPVLASAGKATVPCMVKVGAGGKLRVPLDIGRRAKVEVTNADKSEAVVTVFPFKKGIQFENIGVSSWSLNSKGSHRDYTFNDSFIAGLKIDEVRVKVDKGVVYVTVTQKGKYRSDFYNQGHLQNGGQTQPDADLEVRITGDNPFGPETKGRFILEPEVGGAAEKQKVEFVVGNGKTKTWQYPASQKIKYVTVIIHRGDGRAKISLVQPEPKKAADKKSNRRPQQRSRTIRKPTQEFTVKYPSGRGARVNPNEDLSMTITAVSQKCRGQIVLYKDTKGNKIGSENFSLKKGKTQSWTYPRNKHVVKVSVWVFEGSFKVSLDQSKP
jgi:hypothetical protein